MLSKKGLFIIVLSVAMSLLTLSPGVLNAATLVLQVGQPMMTVDGMITAIDPGQNTTPIIVAERTFVPIRAIVEALGGTAGYAASEKKVTIQLQSTVVELWIGKLETRINGQSTTLAALPFISETGRTMLPLRFVIENLGGQVVWDGAEQRITITHGIQTVIIADFAFSPATLSIHQEETVIWVNHDPADHAIAWDAFNSKTFGYGQSFSFTFKESGTFMYHCSLHPSMQGEIIVK